MDCVIWCALEKRRLLGDYSLQRVQRGVLNHIVLPINYPIGLAISEWAIIEKSLGHINSLLDTHVSLIESLPFTYKSSTVF